MPEERTKQNQAIRIRRLGMSVASYWVGAGLIALGAALQIIEWRYVAHFILIFIVTNTGLYIFFRSGLNLRLADANITMQQITLLMVPFLYVMYHVDTALGRVAILIVSLVGLIYGILDLSVRRFLTVTSIYFTGYLGLFALLSARDPDFISRAGEWMILAAMAVFMVEMALIGGYISQLRAKLRRVNRRVSEMAVRDELTDVYNRHHLIQVLERECARANRGGVFSVCLMDIDRFKQVNDEYGHAAGDEALRRFAAYVGDNIRDIYTFGRWGGEEFLLIMPHTRMPDLHIVVDRLRDASQGLEFGAPGNRFNITVSMGVAESGTDRPRHTELLHRADAALYRAKHTGRNRVCLDETDPTATPSDPGQRGLTHNAQES